MVEGRLRITQFEYALGSGLRYSASAALMAYGISRVILVVVWMSGLVVSYINPFLRALQYLFWVSMGVSSIALALKVVQAPSITKKHLTLCGVLLLTVGIGNGFVELTRLISFQYPELIYTSLSFYASLAYNILLIYLGFKLLRGDLHLGRTTFTALALLALASLLRSVDLDYLIGAPLNGGIGALWPSHLLYTVSMGLAFVTFVLAERSVPVDPQSVTRSGKYSLFRGAVFVYGFSLLYNFIAFDLLQFDEFVAGEGYLGMLHLVVGVYLWSILDIIFALAVISFAVFMKQLAPLDSV